MYLIFKTEIRRKLKSPVVWILIIIMMLLLYVNIENSIEEKEHEKILSYTGLLDEQMAFTTDDYKESLYGKSYEDLVERDKDAGIEISKSRSLYNVEVNAFEDRREAYLEDNFIEKSKADSFYILLLVNIYANSTKNDYGSFTKYLCKIANKELWDKVSYGVKYEDIDFNNSLLLRCSPEGYLYITISCIESARHMYYLYNNKLEPIKTDEFNNLNVLNDWVNNIVPITIIIIIILLSYNIINKDVKEGSTKLLITQSIPRWKYYLAKFFSGSIIVVIVMIIPLFISNSYLKTQVKIQPLNYPLVYDKEGLKTFKPSYNFMEINLEKYERYIGREFYKIPYSKMDNSGLQPLYQRNNNLIGFNKFLLMTFFYSVLFIMFMVAFVELCSTIINNVYLSLLSSTAVYGIFYFLFQPFLYEKNYNLCPFTMNNSARIVAGTHNVTMLTAALVLGLSTMILLVLGVKYFQRKGL